MSKRQADHSELREQSKASSFQNRHEAEEKNEMGHFEDNWEDEIEEDEGVTEEVEDEEEGKEQTKRLKYYLLILKF